jgi:uronate dehydrogenase
VATGGIPMSCAPPQALPSPVTQAASPDARSTAMADSFSVRKPLSPRNPGNPHGDIAHRRVLITGAAGRIGSSFAEHAHRQYDLRLMVREDDDPAPIEGYGEVVTGELADLDRLKHLFTGVDTVVHLAADPSPNAIWDSVIANNITGTYHVFVAAKAAGVRRVIYASSIHAVSGYPVDLQVKSNDPVNPGDLYGVSKCFGEALARYMAEQEGVSAIAIRIGAFQPESAAEKPDSLHMLDAWVSHRDLNQLIERCIDAQALRFAIFAGLSDNRFKRMDITDARELVGYRPQDDLTRENPRLRRLQLNETIGAHNVQDTGKSGLRNEL